MVHDALFERSVRHVEIASFDELLKELAVMDDLVVSAELWVLVAECVEAVRALGDDLLDAHAIEGLDVLHGEHLEDVFVAGSASGVAGAIFGGAEDGITHASAVHQLRERLADLLVLVVEGTSTTNPIEVFGLEGFIAGEDGDRIIDDPIGTVGLAERPRVHLVFHAAIRVAELAREIGLHER